MSYETDGDFHFSWDFSITRLLQYCTDYLMSDIPDAKLLCQGTENGNATEHGYEVHDEMYIAVGDWLKKNVKNEDVLYVISLFPSNLINEESDIKKNLYRSRIYPNIPEAVYDEVYTLLTTKVKTELKPILLKIFKDGENKDDLLEPDDWDCD